MHRAVSLWLLTINSTLLVTACRSDAPTKSVAERGTPAIRRAIVPLLTLDGRFAICRLDSRAPFPGWTQAPTGEFFSATRTSDEFSIVIAETRPPDDAKCERGYRALKVKGPLDFNLVGIFAGLSGTLADAGVSILGFSTYDTDYVFVKHADYDRAVAALRKAGYTITQR
jgi:hypothetical protein